MSLFSLRTQYTAESLQALINEPVDRSEAVRTALDAVDGKLISAYTTGGGNQQGSLIIYDVPDSTAQAAFVAALTASGALVNIDSQRLYNPEETVNNLRKAQAVQRAYQSPIRR